jgi:hypothetical protein
MMPFVAQPNRPNLCGARAYWLMIGGLLLCWVSLAQAQPPTGAQPLSDSNVVLWANPNGRGRYELALLRAILKRTAANHPAYTLSLNSTPLGSSRGRQGVADGLIANVYVSALRQDHYTREKKLLLVRQPIANGLLGYRAAVILPQNRERYKHSTAQHKLRNLTIGQGRNWQDANILRHNHFTVDDSGWFENLFDMLVYQRFDAVFLGLLEVAQEVAASPLQEQLSIAYQPIIYYPLAMVFQVSGHNPKLAQRIEKGLEQVINDGTRDQLLEQHFGDAIQRIRNPNAQILVLEHPNATLMPDLIKPQLGARPR